MEGGGTAAGWRRGFDYLTSLWKTFKIGRGQLQTYDLQYGSIYNYKCQQGP